MFWLFSELQDFLGGRRCDFRNLGERCCAAVGSRASGADVQGLSLIFWPCSEFQDLLGGSTTLTKEDALEFAGLQVQRRAGSSVLVLYCI